MKILCFGACNIDLVYAVESIVAPGQTISAQSLATFPGGKGLNQSIAVAKAGAPVFYAGCMGDDGKLLFDTMSAAGVDLRYLKTVPGKTGHAMIQVDSGAENCIIIFAGANGMVTKEHIDSVLSDFGPGDLLLSQNEISQLPYLIRRAWETGMDVVFNPSPCNENAKKIDLTWVRWLIVNENEALGMTGSEDPAVLQTFIRERYPHLSILMTRGKQGSVCLHGGQVFRQHAYRVDAVDTTAAGDAYTGYFIAGLSRGDDIRTAMDLASAASALAVSREGASASIPTRQEVCQAIQSLSPYSAPSNSQKDRTETFFREHYADGTMTMLADTLGFSVSYTGSWLKVNLGASFTELLHKKRCEVCAMLLQTTELPISEIIHRVGYRNESFFRRKFMDVYGCTPLAYRKRKEG